MGPHVARRGAWTTLGVVALLATYWAIIVAASPRVGITADEPSHIVAGYSYWRFGDYSLMPESGMLGMRIAALPLLTMPLQWFSRDDPNLQTNDSSVAYAFLFRLGNPRDRIVLAARAAVALLGVLTLWLVWRWSSALFGSAGGWLALVLGAFSPTLLAHGGLATSDMAITAALLASVTAYWRVLHRVTWCRLLVAMLATGAALLAKMSGAIVVPLFVALLGIRIWRRSPVVTVLGASRIRLKTRPAIAAATIGVTLAVFLGSTVVVWSGYSFRFSAFASRTPTRAGFELSWPEVLDEQPISIESTSALEPPAPISRPTVATRAIAWMRDHRLLPEAYLWGLAHTQKFAQQRRAFLNGDYSVTGWFGFFPWTFWLKTTLPVLALFAAGVAAFVAAFRAPNVGGKLAYRAAPLIALFVGYWAIALLTHLNIGHRHILPVYPVVFVFAGAAALWLRSHVRRTLQIAFLACVGTQIAEAAIAWPFYLSYFQPLAGGTERGWQHLVDSSFDWGQGLPDLSRWLAAKTAAGNRSPVYLTYFGTDSPRDRGLPVIRFADEGCDHGERVFPVRPHGGWFAISATQYQRIYLNIAGPWNDRFERLYQRLRSEMNGRVPAQIAPADKSRLLQDAKDFEILELGRLCHFLGDRMPNEIVGGSLLIFRLSDDDVNLALNAQLADLDRARSRVATSPP